MARAPLVEPAYLTRSTLAARLEISESTVDDPLAALREIIALRDGAVPDKVADAIRSEARAFRKVKGRLPHGVVSSKERGGA